MKKLTLLILASVILCSLFGCVEEQDTNGLSVVTTSFPVYDMVRQVLGDRGEAVMLLKPGEESHSYDPPPKDIIKINKCDLFVFIGGESDSWAKRIISSANIQSLALIDSVDAIENGHGHGEEIYDEHIWTSLKNGILMVGAISNELRRIDPDNAEYYTKRAEDYISELTSLDKEYEKIALEADKPIVIADRFPFVYMFREYGLEYYAAMEGCSEHNEVSASTVASLISKTREHKITHVFVTELSNGAVADTICGETGAKKLVLHSCNNVTKEEFERGESYVSIMKQNLLNLRVALGIE